jgi:hypothetical protein
LAYYAKTQRGVLGLFLAITLMPYKWINTPNWLLYLQILLVVVIVLSIFIQFKFKIDEHHLTYQIMFLSMSIYRKGLNPEQIIQIKFKRIGWSLKGLLYRSKKDFTLEFFILIPTTCS